MYNKYEEFLKTVIELSKNDTIKWSYLDTAKTLYEKMEWTTKEYKEFPIKGSIINFGEKKLEEIISPNFNIDKSFYAKLDNMFIVLLNKYDRYEFYIIPLSYRNVEILSFSDYSELLTRLSQLLISYFPTAEVLVDKFMEVYSDDK